MNDARGATPRIGATPNLHYPFGPGWQPYRLPCPGANEFVTARGAGIGFKGEPAAGGAIPPAAGDPPKPPDPEPTPPTPPKPATGEGEPDADGMSTDAGRRALAAERKRGDDAEAALTELRAKTATEDEKRDASLKAAAGKDRDEYWAGVIRATRVESTLVRLGMTDPKQLSLAANAPEFASLTVDEKGQLAALDTTAEKFKTDYPGMFATAKAAAGQPTRGAQGTPPADRPKTLSDAISARLSGAQA